MRKGYGYWVMAGLLVLGTAGWRAEAEVPNGGFEQEMEGWETFGQNWRPSNFATETHRDAHEGEWAAVNDVKAGDQDEWRGIARVVPAEDKRRYNAGVWIRTAQLESSECYLEVQFLDKDDNVVEFYQSEPVTMDQEYTHVGLEEIYAPKGTKSAAIRAVVHMISPPTEGDDFHIFDNFEFAEYVDPNRPLSPKEEREQRIKGLRASTP